MITSLLRLLAEMGPATAWVVKAIVGAIGAFVLYVGAAMTVTLFTTDPKRAQIRYKVFRDLLELFRRGRR